MNEGNLYPIRTQSFIYIIDFGFNRYFINRILIIQFYEIRGIINSQSPFFDPKSKYNEEDKILTKKSYLY